MTITEYQDLLVSEGVPVASWCVCPDDPAAIDFLDASGTLVARAKGLSASP